MRQISSSELVSRWIVLVLVASVWAMLDGGWLVQWTALEPDRVWHGEVWRVMTWPVVELGPVPIAFTIACIYKFGGALAPRWGDRRLQRFMLQLVIAGGVAASIGALISDHAWHMVHTGGFAVCDALVIGWARQYPNERLRMFSFLELSGQKLVIFTAGITILIALSTSVFVMMPEVVMCLGAALYPREWLTR
jgi:membrane associated rhomboid family serine protease